MQSIHDAILSKDPKAARRAVDAQLDDASQTALRVMTAEEQDNA